MKTQKNSKKNAVKLLVVVLVAKLLVACNDPKIGCDPKCGCASDGTATTWAYCMATK